MDVVVAVEESLRLRSRAESGRLSLGRNNGLTGNTCSCKLFGKRELYKILFTDGKVGSPI